MTRHSARASPALQGLTESDPAMAALALWCDHRDGEIARKAETQGTTITYGPGFSDLAAHEQAGLAAHHILHAALRHSARMAAMQARLGIGFAPDLYTIATDAIVNEALLSAGYALPRPALRLTGLLADQGQVMAAAEALAVWDADKLYIHLARAGSGGQAAQQARASAARTAQEDDLRPTPDSEATPEAANAAEWRQHVARAMEQGRLAGRGIGMVGHRMADLPQARTPWEQVLRGLVSRAVQATPTPSHRRPARPWIAAEAEARRTHAPTPAFQPGWARSTGVPRIAIALDTSSSIDSTRLGLFMAEVAGIARRCTAELHLIPFDDGAHPTVKLDPAGWRTQLSALTLPRDGGTSFAPAIARAAGLQLSILILLTDLDGPFGPAPRGLPVIWAIPAAVTPPAPPFGRVLSLAD